MLKYLIAFVAVLFLLCAGVGVWLFTSVGRGMVAVESQVEEILAPISEKLTNGEELGKDEVKLIANQKFTRYDLYQLLDEHDRIELFPEEYLTKAYEAEAGLVYWMLHPNELDAPPEEIQLVKKATRKLDGDNYRFFIFQYKMPEDHWAGDQGWMFGIAGPVDPAAPPYSEMIGAFARVGDKVTETTPDELLDWYLQLFGAE